MQVKRSLTGRGAAPSRLSGRSIGDSTARVAPKVLAYLYREGRSAKAKMEGYIKQKELAKTCDGELKTELCQIAAYYEHRLNKGNKAIYHLEAFVAKFMAIYMKFVEETFGGF